MLKRKTSAVHRLQSISSGLTLVDLGEVSLDEVFASYGKIDAVVHVAASYGRNGESVAQVVDANLDFPLHLLEAAVAAGVGLFINTDTALDKFINAYALSKRQFSEWGKHFARQKKIRFLNLRLEHFYGAGDDDTKFTTHVIKSCLANVPELKLTPGEQRRDFVYIDDVVDAYLLLLAQAGEMQEDYVEVDVGSGEAVQIKEFVGLVHRLTGSSTHLNFGAHPYREGEAMFLQADTAGLRKLGWSCRHTLEQGLKLAIEGYKQ